MSLWAYSAQDKINELVNPIILKFYNKKNIRSLSYNEYSSLEDIKNYVFFNLTPYDNIDRYNLQAYLSNKNNNVLLQYYNWLKALKTDLDRDLTVDEIKQAKASFYSMVYTK